MPEFLKSVARFVTADQKDTASVNTFEGFQSNGAIVVRDRRGTAKAEIPEVSEKGATAATRSQSTSPPARSPSARRKRWRASTAGRLPR